MKYSIIYIIFFFSIVGFGQNNPFTKLKFDKVVIYDFGGMREGDFSIIDKNGQLAKSVTKQVVLEQNTVSMLNRKLEDKNSFGELPPSCFDPHLGIVYYFKEKPVAYISICMDCNRLDSSKELDSQKQGEDVIGDKVYYNLDGMSDLFRKYLNGLLKKYNFSHQIKE